MDAELIKRNQKIIPLTLKFFPQSWNNKNPHKETDNNSKAKTNNENSPKWHLIKTQYYISG